ncbi:MAG: hypothetical protein QOE03_2326, partial [Micromonosporaceae bacterium]|nr:hypothetical protein [Micromonosporaceae bacterium]
MVRRALISVATVLAVVVPGTPATAAGRPPGTVAGAGLSAQVV